MDRHRVIGRGGGSTLPAAGSHDPIRTYRLVQDVPIEGAGERLRDPDQDDLVLENDAWFGYVCALDEGDDWTDEAVWPKANPLLDVSITRKYLREQIAEAQGIPAKQDIVKRLSFCVWTEGAARWLPLEGWDAMTDGALIPPGTTAFAGLDLASTTDLTAFTLVAPREECDQADHAGALHRPARPVLGTRGGGAPPRRA